MKFEYECWKKKRPLSYKYYPETNNKSLKTEDELRNKAKS